MKRNEELEATIVGKFSVMAPLLDERTRRLWAAAESVAIGYGGDALVSAATGLARETIRTGRRELARGVEATTRIRRAGAAADLRVLDAAQLRRNSGGFQRRRGCGSKGISTSA